MSEESKRKLDVASLFPSKGDPRRPPEWYGRALFYAVIAVYLGWFVFTSYGKITYIVFDIVIALFLALAVEPLVIRLIRHGWKRGVASVTCLAGLLVIVIVLMALFGNMFAQQMISMVKGLPDLYNQFAAFVDAKTHFKLPEMNDLGGEIMKNIFGNLYLGIDDTGLHATMSSAGLTLGAGGQMIVSGPRGATGITKLSTFAVGFVLILFTLFVVQNLINSREGRAIKAVRDNRIAAESVGINVTAFRMKAFVVSAFLAGMAGALYAMNYGSITATKFNFNTSINILVFVVLGGMGNILGSIISATVLYILPEAMRGLQDYRMILYAVVLIVVMLFTWSPKVKEAMSVVTDKIAGAFKKKEAGSNE